MNIRRVLLDVARVNITVTEIDVQTIGMDITVEGDNIDIDKLFRAIESTGAVVHSIDEMAAEHCVTCAPPRRRTLREYHEHGGVRPPGGGPRRARVFARACRKADGSCSPAMVRRMS